MSYVFSTGIDQPIDEAIETLKAALLKQHLGIVSGSRGKAEGHDRRTGAELISPAGVPPNPQSN